jgi:hypothetical protein
MCPFCISAAVSVAAGTTATAGIGALFAFARKLPERTDDRREPPHAEPRDASHDEGA